MKEASSSRTSDKALTLTKRSSGASSFTADTPKPALRLIDAVVLIMVMVIGAGIFRTLSVVAAVVPDTFWFFGVSVLRGIISLAGALCYSDLSTTFPNAGGDYHFLKIAYGNRL